MRKRFSGETLEVHLIRHLGEVGKKQRQIKKKKENFKLLLVDFNTKRNESQCVDEETTAIEKCDIKLMEVP